MAVSARATSLTRRTLLRLSALGGITAALAACAGAASPTAAPAGAQGAAAKPTEAAKPAESKPAGAAEPTKPAAATSGTAPQAAAPAAGGKAVELEVWAHWDQGVDWMTNAMKNFNFPNSSITIKKVVYPIAEAHSKMLAAISSGQGLPDIMRIEQGRFSPFIKGQTVGLTDLTDKVGAKKNDLVLGSAVDYWTWKGKIYGLGNELNVVTLAYRKDMFDEVGAKTPFESWKDFGEAGALLKQKKNVFATSWHDQSEGDFQNLTFASGGKYLDENGDFAGATDTGVEIMTMMHEQIHKSKIATIAPVTGDSTWAPPIFWAAYKEDKIASTQGAPWHNGNMGRDVQIGPSQAGKWRLQRIPKGFGDNKPTSTQGGTSVSIPAKAPHPDEAWQVIEFTHLTKAVLQDNEERGILVTYKPALADPKIKDKAWDFYGGQKTGELYIELAQDMPRIQQSPWKPEIDKAFRDIVATPILGNASATSNDIKAAFDKMKTEIERIKKL
jgi:arabinosaccharide transport system substrate-binding protein